MQIFKKDKIKPVILIFIVLTILEIILSTIITNYQYNNAQIYVNKKISNIIGMIEQEYPDISEIELIKILNSDINSDKQLSKYGLKIQEGCIIRENKDVKTSYIIQNSIVLIIFQILIFILFDLYLKYRENKINKITEYVKEINNKKYKLKLDEMTEGELSKLESELYKITVMLKEEADSSNMQKVNLAESIADISHQLKTPLTSISIMLENLNENPDIDENLRNEFIRQITMQIEWMKWLVISLLKFSKLDANAVQFKKEEIKISELFKKIKQDMAIPLEIKNIELVINGKDDVELIGDFNWQKEAITNILKNCIEHTNENKKIYINYEENNIYTKIIIKDEGNGITPKDLPHIFERFYKGANSSAESYGIGLALSKSIIEKDEGIISCKSTVNEGTTFEIKYLKKYC